MKLYGIKNCQQVTKSFTFLDAKEISYEFVDYKKTKPTPEQLEKWIDARGVDLVINKRGTTWRNLPDDKKQNLTRQSAIEIARNNPSIIKRPIIEKDSGEIIIGYNELLKILS